MNMNSYSLKCILLGLLLWMVGTLAIRFGGYHLLSHHPLPTVALYAGSFLLMALLVRRIFSRMRLDHSQWPAASTFLMLPTLLLDPFSCAFFSRVFPNADPATAGVFGGWMLIFCGGAVAGVWAQR